MKKIIEKYKKFIFIYVLVNLFALIANLMLWDVHFHNSDKNGLQFYPLTSHSGDASNHLWPFVKFYEYQDWMNKAYATNQYGYHSFNGIFYQYDLTEFLLYIGLLFIVIFYKSYIQDKKFIDTKDVTENYLDP